MFKVFLSFLLDLLSSVNSESLFPFAFRNKPPPVFRLPYSEHDLSQTNLSSTEIMWMGLLFRYWIGEGFLVTDNRLYTLRCRAVPPSVPPSKIFMNCERCMQYCSCPTVHDWIAVYPALFYYRLHGATTPYTRGKGLGCAKSESLKGNRQTSVETLSTRFEPHMSLEETTVPKHLKLILTWIFVGWLLMPTTL